jgi:hypothetical protein
MQRRDLLVSAAAAACGLDAALAAPRDAAITDIYGVKFPAELDVGGQHLLLNGAGARFKMIFKVYALGLYLAKKTNSADEAVSMPGAKRLMLSPLRELPMSEFGRLVTKGIQSNASKEDFVKIVPDVARIGQLFAAYSKASPGEWLVMDWIPGTGMVATFRGAVQGDPFVEPVFFRTIMKIWLGASPPDARLRSALLGEDPDARRGNGGGDHSELL